MQLKIIRLFVLILEHITKHFVSLNLRPKQFKVETYPKFYDSYLAYANDWCILVQGPIVNDHDFTMNTIMFYRHLYPNVSIILSSWIGEKSKIDENRLKDLGVYFLFNEMPTYRGISNINLQLVSTQKGLKFASDLGVKYILKTRTDQRVCKTIDFLGHMQNLQLNFPLAHGVLSSRLVIASTNSFKSRFYGITDMFMFGQMADMQLYWEIPLESEFQQNVPLNSDPVYFIANKQAEGYLVNHFFEALRFTPQWTLEDSQFFIANFFCVVDKEQLDLFWLKYERFIETISFHRKNDAQNWQRFEFADWLKSFHLYGKKES
jgi:hypothetical protein